MLNVNVTVPPKSKLVLTDFSGGFTDWKCGVGNNSFTEFENFEILDNKTILGRYGSRILDQFNPKVPNGFTVERMDCLKGNILYFSEKNVSTILNGTFTNLVGPVSTDIMGEAVEGSCSDSSFWQDHIYAVDDAFSKPVKIFCDKFGNLVAITAGLPSMVTPPTVTSTVDEGAKYAYAFAFCYEYNAQNITHTDFGEPSYVQICDGPDFDTLGESVEITNIPVLVSAPGENYDEARIKVKIYRTTNGGTTFYQIGTVNNGVTTFSDGQNDNDISNNGIVIFNQNSNITYDEPPASKFIEITGDVAWYGHSQAEGVTYKNRVYQSLPSNPDVVPRDFFVEFQGEVNGLSSYDIYPIVSVISNEGECTLYRIEGVLDDEGRNILQRRVISETVSSINNNSFVKGKGGLYFFGTDGVYVTDGIRANLLTEKWNETYCKITETAIQKKNVYGTYDKVKGIVYWAITSDPGFTQNDKLLVYKEKTGTFHWWSNEDCLKSSSLISKDKGELIRGHYDGYVLIHTENEYTDPVIDDTTSARNWRRKHIPWCLRSVDLDAGDCDSFKKFSKIHLKGKPNTDVTLKALSYDNGCTSPKTLKEITHTSSDGWCTDELGWCTNPNGWLAGTDCYLDQVRTFPCNGRRAKTKCVELKASKKDLSCSFLSDPSTYLNVEGSTGIVSRVDLVKFSARDHVGDEIEINGVLYPIIDVNESGQAIVDFNGDVLTDGVYPYVHRGYALNERVHLSCVTIFYNREGGENAYCAPEDKA